MSFYSRLLCAGASSCPCPNHLGPEWRQPLIFPDNIDSHPSICHVANGNECPTGHDADVINHSIPILQSQIQAMEDASQQLTRFQNALRLDLDEVEREIVRLREHQGALTRAIDRRSRIMAPIRRLPTEILTNILWITILLPFTFGHTTTPKRHERVAEFTFGLTTTPDTKHEGDAELDTFELVCKRWRRVVLQSPTLWSKVVINPLACYFRTPRSSGARSLARRIDRSAHVELDVKMFSFSPHRDEQPLPPLLMTMLAQICTRIRFLSVTLSTSKMLSLSPLRESFHSLRFLYADHHASNPSDPLTLFDKAPKLTIYLTIRRTNSTQIGIPWSQIVRHEACGDATDILTTLECLEAASSLEEGTFSLDSGSQIPLRVGLDPIQVSTSLTSLTVYMPAAARVVRNAHPLRQLFQQCSFPALDELYVSTRGVTIPDVAPDTADTFHALLLCLQRSRSPLSVLSYDHGPVAPADVDEFFRTTPTISHVEFTRTSSGLNDAAFRSLSVQPGQVNICAPRLKSLLLEGQIDFDAANFAAVVKSRWDVAPLKSIDLHWHMRMYERDWEDFDMVAGGIVWNELNGYGERGMHLAICRAGQCNALVKSQYMYDQS